MLTWGSSRESLQTYLLLNSLGVFVCLNARIIIKGLFLLVYWRVQCSGYCYAFSSLSLPLRVIQYPILLLTSKCFLFWRVTSLVKGGREGPVSFFVIIIFGRQSFGAIIIFGDDDDEEFQHERTRRRLCFLFLRGKRKYFNQLANISKSRTNNKKVSC